MLKSYAQMVCVLFSQVIKDASGEEVGIFVLMSFPMTFSVCLDRLSERLDIFSYISKSTRDLSEQELAESYGNGFFVRLANGEMH